MADTKLLLSQLSIDGQLYHLKDSELTTTVTNLSTKVGNIATEVGTITTTVENHDTQIYALQQSLGGLDARTLAALEKITQELKGEENDTTKAFVTLVDRLKGIGNNSEGKPATVVEYVADYVDDQITGFATETLYYGSEIQNVVLANGAKNSPLYDSSTETLNLTTKQYRLLSAEKGSEYIQDDQNS